MNKIKGILLSIIVIIFILNINIVISSTKEACVLFFNKVFISVFPFIILSNILIYYDYHIFLKNIFGKYISKIFNIDKEYTIIFLLSILTSTPNNAVYIKDMLESNILSEKDATKLLTISYFPSIPFVIATIGIGLFNSFKIGLILWINVIITNIIIGLYLRKEKTTITKKDISFKKYNNIFILLKESIISSINILLIILGNLIIFNTLINISRIFIVNNYFNTFISIILEITSGVFRINLLNINIMYKLILTNIALNFTSLSILFQSFSILNKYNINIKKILLIKIVFSLLSTFSLLILYFIQGLLFQ